MDTNSNYIPFGEEWKKECQKFSKSDIIEMYATSQRHHNELKNEKIALENWLKSKIKAVQEDLNVLTSNGIIIELNTTIEHEKAKTQLSTLKGILKILEV
ncbi:hypothetical protein V9L05_01415 [Bernardetia sp. Wsw4-3y2]|uniref:hypothetical protein n=1 Tax=Bernardetia sp. Wsw4-3y2 TaxID=3127471 RepID=UPI0030D5B1FC